MGGREIEGEISGSGVGEVVICADELLCESEKNIAPTPIEVNRTK
jgi:hypothetical protein